MKKLLTPIIRNVYSKIFAKTEKSVSANNFDHSINLDKSVFASF